MKRACLFLSPTPPLLPLLLSFHFVLSVRHFCLPESDPPLGILKYFRIRISASLIGRRKKQTIERKRQRDNNGDEERP